MKVIQCLMLLKPDYKSKTLTNKVSVLLLYICILDIYIKVDIATIVFNAIKFHENTYD